VKEEMVRDETIEFEYMYQPPKKWTFEQPKLRKWVEKNCKGKVLNLFAGKTKLNVDEFRVDSSDEFEPDHLGDAMEFLKGTDMRFDTVILDPPYNLRKSREKYNGKYLGSFTKIKKLLPLILKDGGKIITLGFDSVGMARRLGFKKIAICLVCHGGDHNDTIGVVEVKMNKSICSIG
jgi:hypothetical protein